MYLNLTLKVTDDLERKVVGQNYSRFPDHDFLVDVNANQTSNSFKELLSIFHISEMDASRPSNFEKSIKMSIIST